MARSLLYRTKTINLKPILSELEDEFKYVLILNSACGEMKDVKMEMHGIMMSYAVKLNFYGIWDLYRKMNMLQSASISRICLKSPKEKLI